MPWIPALALTVAAFGLLIGVVIEYRQSHRRRDDLTNARVATLPFVWQASGVAFLGFIWLWTWWIALLLSILLCATGAALIAIAGKWNATDRNA